MTLKNRSLTNLIALVWVLLLAVGQLAGAAPAVPAQADRTGAAVASDGHVFLPLLRQSLPQSAAISPVASDGHTFLPLLRRSLPQPAAISPWGMNLYLAKGDRARDNRPLLADLATQAGVQWTREELPWALIEPTAGTFQPLYDDPLLLAATKGLGIVGMLLTTPDWARDPTCRPPLEAYWCPPTDPQQFARFAAWMAERYDGDGFRDAPGSPRVAAWEIWNEPNDVGNWPDIGADANARKRRYGEMLVATYQAIKAADPTAIVLLGGVYIFDGGCGNGICDGFNFLSAPGGVFQQVPQARQAFDVFATHPYAAPTRPDDPQLPRLVLIEGTTRAARGWLDSAAIGRPDAPIWITELGWCTAPGACPGGAGVTEEQQANYLVRAQVIAQQNGVQHISWFQFEDAFDDSNRMWGNGAIVHNYDGTGYPLKLAYYAYRTLARQLRDAAVAGIGPLHTHQYDPSQPYTNSGGTYDYRYRRGTTLIDVLWRPNDSVQVAFPVQPGMPITRIDRDGVSAPLTPAGGAVQLTLSERPVLIVQGVVAAAAR